MKNCLTLLTLFSVFVFPLNSVAQNLIEADLVEWVEGETGATASFSAFGGANERIVVNGPFGNPVIVWSASSTATTTGSGQSGGLIHKGVNVNTSKTYRISYWMKSTGTTACNNDAAFFTKPLEGGSNVSPLRIETGMTPYYWPNIYRAELTTGKWFLIVGYVYSKNETAFTLPSGVYDPDTYDENLSDLPEPITSGYNFRFPNSHDELSLFLRNTLWDCQSGETQYSYMPRIEEVNGSEKPLLDILVDNSSGGDTTGGGNAGGETVWSKNGTNISYTDGNVGIATSSIPIGYKLAVDGKIIAEEVKVEMSDTWPDYVFAKDYTLPTLKEVQKHITEKGHLINIPSAEEVEANGIELGEMNKLLLEKIEELTLYILEQEKRIKKNTLQNQELLKRLKQ